MQCYFPLWRFLRDLLSRCRESFKILGITLTKSSHTKDADGKPLAMAGFPYHALDTYLPKLIRAGERVAICDQLEAPKRSTEEISPSKVESPQQEQNNSSGIHR